MACQVNEDDDFQVHEYFNEEYFEQNGHSATKPITGLGSGDSMLFLNVLPDDLAESAFDTMNNEIDWHVMNHKGSEVPRLVSIQGESRESDCAHPLYRHPAEQQPELVPFTPLANRSRVIIEALLRQPLNHALIQKYRSGRDNIGEHADKTLDVLKGTAVVNLSLGASRVMTLKSKKDYVTKLDEAGVEVPTKRLFQKITLPHNSVFVLGWQTNRDFLHLIKADKRMSSEKLQSELACDEQRISLTFRTIATYLDASGKITGQGARKSENIESDQDEVAQTDALLCGFGAENKSSRFDWEDHYGQGFDIVNFVFVKDSESDGL